MVAVIDASAPNSPAEFDRTDAGLRMVEAAASEVHAPKHNRDNIAFMSTSHSIAAEDKRLRAHKALPDGNNVGRGIVAIPERPPEMG